MEDSQPPDEIRSAVEVAQRCLAVFSVIGLALGAERAAVLAWLSENDLWKELAPSEAGFIDTRAPSRKQLINASWLSERLIVLLWALGKVARIPSGDKQCDTAIFQNILPPYSSVSVQEFVTAATLRPETELIECADQILNLHWTARDAKIKGVAPLQPVNLEVIQERHHAINWVIGYDGLDWDEVTTDT